MNQTTDNTATAPQQPRPSRSTFVRLFLALACSHALAPYAVARFTIRYQLDGTTAPFVAVGAAVAMIVGAWLAFGQLINQSANRKFFYGLVLVFLWFLMAFVQLSIAADSAIAKPVLALLWGVGTIWIGWTVWAWCFFHAKTIVAGSLVVGLGAGIFWNTVDITGLTGDARVEFAWRRISLAKIDDRSNLPVSEVGSILWPGYLGSNRDANAQDVRLSEDWDANPPLELWRVNCGAGWSSFAATEHMLFTQEQLEDRDCVTARSLAGGQLIWIAEESGEGFKSGVGGNGPRATPTLHNQALTDGEQLVLFAIGPTGNLQCLNATNGDVVWEVDVCELFPGENLDHAICGSPLIVGDLVIVCPPSEKGPCVAAFNTEDGDLAWECRSDWQASYSSPTLMTINGLEQIVVHAGGGVLSVDPENGTTLWQFEWTNEWDNNATQPIAVQDHPNALLFATGYRGGVVRVEFDEEAASLVPKEIWQNRKSMRTKFCNVSQFGDLLVGLDNGILCGVDVRNGKQLWKKGRYGHGQLLHVGDHCLIVAEKGKLFLLKPDTDSNHELFSFDALDRKTWNHPILVEDQLIVRNDQEIVCLRLPTQD